MPARLCDGQFACKTADSVILKRKEKIKDGSCEEGTFA